MTKSKLAMALLSTAFLAACNELSDYNFVENISATTSDYVRNDWDVWLDYDSDCQNAKVEAAIRQARYMVPPPSPSAFALADAGDRDGRRTYCDNFGMNGLIDAYTRDVTLTDATADQVVSVKFAHERGGHKWNADEKRAFYNDFRNIVLTDRSISSAKADKSFMDWQPSDDTTKCVFYSASRLIVQEYELEVTKKEAKWLESELKRLKCSTDLYSVRWNRAVNHGWERAMGLAE